MLLACARPDRRIWQLAPKRDNGLCEREQTRHRVKRRLPAQERVAEGVRHHISDCLQFSYGFSHVRDRRA
jgi:hypothetical protein